MVASDPTPLWQANKTMWMVVRRLSLGVSLIILASASLLISDWHQRKAVGGGKTRRVAIVQHSAHVALEEGVLGVLDGLVANGLVDGQNIHIRRFNADGDFTVANAIAGQVVAAGFDLVVTISTPSLQTVAKANSSERVIQVFGLVADPYHAGVGIGRKSALDHPKRLVGVPSPLPVADSFRLARKLFPGLQSVGIVWNPSDANSEITTMQAREICQELRINLREVNVDSSVAVAEAAAALTAQGVQGLWVGGDNTVALALDSAISAARKARIPVFSVLPTEPNRGTLFDIGTNFYDAGRMTGKIRPKLLLLDEHTAALDPKSADQVIRLTEDIVSRDKLTTLMVTHSMQQAASLGDRLVMMHRGRIIHDLRGAEKRRARVDDLLARFEEVRRREQLDETAAEMLRRAYV